MSRETREGREGSLEAPTRHPLDWRNPAFYDEDALGKELERIFEICHGCRRCFSLCQAFPTLFDAIDSTASGELAEVDRKAYWQVVDHCYLCDMCFMTKCPYVPPHPWNVDFPHLMLRAKAVRARREGLNFRDRVLTSTEAVGNLAGIPVVAEIVNAVNRSTPGRALLERTLGVARDAPVPVYRSRTARKRLRRLLRKDGGAPAAAVPSTSARAPDEAPGAVRATGAAPAERAPTSASVPAIRGRVALFTTCYGNRNEPQMVEDLAVVLRHNGIPVRLVPQERCCGMPRLELGDLEGIDRLKRENIPPLKQLVDEGWDLVAPIPSCVLMFKQELPLMYPADADVQAVRASFFDPFEYLMLRHRAGLLRTDFKASLGKVSYHVPCHLRVQNIGLKTRDVLKLVPDTTVDVIERCSGHDGTYGVKQEFRAASVKIGRPVAERVQRAKADHYSSDCPMAGHQIESLLDGGSAAPNAAPHGTTHRAPEHPLTLLRRAYGI
ncbi:MAG TPA: heterodisulfide reductase-related iron-sulfur binding cluster [Steroidobacteraceae bacterium]|nr:heterodisulfide reductase-related iron-sulfur binding cluster [Steroidobacteraceae bacterium]